MNLDALNSQEKLEFLQLLELKHQKLMVERFDSFIDEFTTESPPARHHKHLIEKLQQVADGKIKRLMVFMPPGSAKALALHTPVPTPQGWKLMGDLRVGDKVFDENGLPCNVTWVSPIWKNRPCYEVKTDCGDSIIADNDHEWVVRLCGKREKYSTIETHELAKKRSKRPMIKRAKALVLHSKKLPLDPYLLGVWLGDGNSHSGEITSGDEDREWLRNEIESLGYKTRDRKASYLFAVTDIRKHLVVMGLLNDPHHKVYGKKHIPIKYLRASIEQRISLLQGLIDTDGTVCKKRGCATFCSTNKDLALQVRELVRSLGVKAGWSESPAMLNGIHHGIAYKVSFYHERAARLPRKAVLCRNQYRTPDTYVEAVRCKNYDTVCIEVDSPSHLFLAGESMTPTHNSYYANVMFSAWWLARNPGKKLITASYSQEVADKWGRRVRALVRDANFEESFGVKLSQESQAAGRWALNNDSEYYAVGVGGSITSFRADGAIIDDPVKGREDAESETIRAKTKEWYQADFWTRLKPGAFVVLIMTRWHEDDIAGWLIEQQTKGGEQWEMLSLPMVAEGNDPLGRAEGESLWPEWFTADMIQQAQRDARNWSSLYQQRPAPETGAYFDAAWFKYYDKLPSNVKIYGASDYAVSDGSGDYTVHGVFALDPDDNLYIVDWWRGQKSSLDWVEQLVLMIKTHHPVTWFEESGVIYKSMNPLISKRQQEAGAWCARKQITRTKSKEMSAQSIRGRMQQGKVYFPYASWVSDLKSELLTFPAGKHDDQVDVMALIGMALGDMDAKQISTKPIFAGHGGWS